MMGKLSRQKKIIFLFIVLHLLYAFIWGWLKTDCYVDEYFTYGLANYEGSILMEVENGKAYTGTEVFDKYFLRLLPKELLIFLMFGHSRLRMCILLFTM